MLQCVIEEAIICQNSKVTVSIAQQATAIVTATSVFWNLNLAAVVLGLAWDVWKKKSFLGNVTYTQPQWGWHNCPPQESVQLIYSNEKYNERKTNEDIWL